MTFISIHSVIIYVVFLAHVWDAPGFVPLNPGVTEVVSEEMLTVGRNLDSNGQKPYLLTLFWFILYLSYSNSFYTYLDPVSPFTVLLWSFLSFYSKTRRISHLGIPTPMTFLRVREPETKVKTIFLKKMLVDCADAKCLICFFDWLNYYRWTS